ncbi:MAG: HlyD family efflux transporter periplasmic adaptor subunit [Planctomycetota bacterium]|nr:MAG: HlyD family efflux transporter periplasmic adaptor subunit [Planctomycetota bacterium]REJ96018.1 MAG: HlyD family efflux transporter periplasmic adaptor subunit [Planctomycetota bacterium]REK25488.1 MAG: HlyD family efflux transporter periplasmic adaptor subunit [Planctomycetota bacterium]REK45924.1 MAG: HlyD family efflux transporter periplasmic adaptor subunit [Planctomycetota bacterium]
MTARSQRLTAASSRPLAVRARADLSASRQEYEGRGYWVVKDPVGLNYFRFHEEEYFILRRLDGRQSLEAIRRAYQREFAPEQISTEEVARFVGTLYHSGLVLADVPGQGEQLVGQHDEKRRRERLSRLSNVLAIRFQGLDPERLLAALYPAVRWLFHPLGVAASLLLVLAALVLIGSQWDVFLNKLPAFHEFFRAQNWIWLAVALAGTKILHEFGHGLTCKHFGGECHEMGVMLLVLTPCLYCNVSDSWMLPSKWRRAAVGAAGMYVEVVLAAACTFLWWFTHPGLLNQLCLSVIFVSSVSTILFNANPLLRYDGYYILADLIEIPNLRSKASAILNRKLGRWFLGLAEPEDPFLPRRRQSFFAFYSVAAAVYRWIVLGSILWFLYKVFEPYGLQILGQLIALVAIYGMFVQPLVRLVKFFYVPGRLQKVNRTRFSVSLAGVTLVLAALLFVPLPHHVLCTLELRPYDAAQVFVDVPGNLEEVLVDEGEYVEAGQPLARLRNLDVQIEAERLAGQRQRQRARVASLLRDRHRRDRVGEEATAALPAAEETLLSIEQELEQKRRELAQLELRSPRAGVVMLPPLKQAQPTTAGGLSAWSGTPLEPRNRGALLQASERLCQIGDPKSLEAILVIDQADIELVVEGQAVEICLDAVTDRWFDSSVASIARVELESSPERLAAPAGGALSTTTDELGRQQLVSTSYQARVLLPDEEGQLHRGLRGRAKIHTAPQMLATRLYRLLRQTFNFSL